jgi:hypothetical protein
MLIKCLAIINIQHIVNIIIIIMLVLVLLSADYNYSQQQPEICIIA